MFDSFVEIARDVVHQTGWKPGSMLEDWKPNIFVKVKVATGALIAR